MNDSRSSEGAERVWLDRQHPQIHKAQVAVAQAVRNAVGEAGLSRVLVELINLRVSQINGCVACLNAHTRDAVRAGETTQRIGVLSAWRDAGPLFSEQERAALTWAESLTTLPDPRQQDIDYAEASRHLNEEQLSAVGWVVVAINAFNRISIASRHPVRPRPDR